MFSAEQHRSQFVRDGFVIVPKLIESAKLADVQRTIQSDFGDRSTEPTKNLLPHQLPPSFAPVADTVRTVVDTLLGEAAPLKECRVSVFHPGEAWNSLHVDGQGRYTEGQRSWRNYCFFRILVAVYCSDVPGPGHGGLRIIPGGHDCVAEWFRSFAASFFDSSYEVARHEELYRSFASGMQFLNPLAHARPMEAGDVLIAHCLMPHGVDIVSGTEPRRGLYLRFGDPVFTDYRQLSDPWAGWQLQK
ncbi:MAG: hypothetical protein U0136_13690 [Bdellovibrionota bacterium]